MCKTRGRFELNEWKNFIAHEGDQEWMPAVEAAVLI
jgi:hypothetical protein